MPDVFAPFLSTIFSKRLFDRGSRRNTKVRSSKRQRTALTLIEMLVSVALTLLVVLAIVRIFDVLGSSVRRSRSALELSAQLRNVTNQLQDDLDRITVKTLPPVKMGSGSGFLEIIEGPDRDKHPNWGKLHDTEVFQGDHLTNIGSQIIDESGWYGDLDDILMFTIASEDKPFIGRFGPPGAQRTIRSKYALVAWWVERSFNAFLDPATGAQISTGVPSGFRLHRRLLLIDPSIGSTPGTPDFAYLANYDMSNPVEVNHFLNTNDLAVRPPKPAEVNSFALTKPRPFAASMDDLSLRHNRWGHVPGGTQAAWPNILITPRAAEPQLLANTSNPYSATNTYSANDKAWNFYTLLSRRFDGPASNLDFSGEDVLLGDILAFDVRVYDPRAPLAVETPDGDTNRAFLLTPKDAGYQIPPPAARNIQGAFVDLFYSARDPNFATPGFGNASFFSGVPNVKSGLMSTNFLVDPAIYDTWSEEYERDNVNQNGVGQFDQGNNGIDDDGDGLVDDIDEADTVAPYPYPLRGIEVTIRAIEANSQQIRQVSVVADFQND